jgi:hypothetical protein
MKERQRTTLMEIEYYVPKIGDYVEIEKSYDC